jgi:hypothetical protein
LPGRPLDTEESILDNFCMGAFGAISIALARTGFVQFAGFVYFLVCVPKTIIPWVMGIKRRKAEAKMLVSTPGKPESVPTLA